MEIKKGDTLGKFIWYVHNVLYGPLLMSNGYNAIIRYTTLYLISLTKEMFVNEINKPNIENYAVGKGYDLKYHEDLESWEAAEKKVIFKGWRINIQDEEILSLCHNSIEIFVELNKITGVWTYCTPSKEDSIATTGDLFQATNREMETQNIEI